MPPNDNQAPRLRRPWLAVASAAAVGVLIVVAVVWPAEYEYDPLGTGALLGLVYMGEDRETPLHDQTQTYRQDSITFTLEPFQSVEYKYELTREATLVFDWRATAEVVSDLHAEPVNAPLGYAETFDLRRATEAAGSYTATFNGVHGWFWENRGQDIVEVQLKTSGFYSRAIEYRDGDQFGYERFESP